MPAAPPRDGNGDVQAHDHQEIPGDFHVIRRTTCRDLVRNTDTGVARIASGAYCESSDAPRGMSVDIEEWMAADGLSPDHYITDPEQGAVRMTVRDLRALGLQVGWDPIPGNPHHGEVWGLTNSGRRRKVSGLAQTVRKAKGET
jgi:hypothetical protein